MSTDLQPKGDPTAVGAAEVQYLTDSSHSHEGGHRITVDSREVLVLPDGRTTGRNRRAVITRVLAGEPNPVETLVGGLVLAGATNITIDGNPILTADPTVIASLRLDVHRVGETIDVTVTTLGAGS